MPPSTCKAALGKGGVFGSGGVLRVVVPDGGDGGDVGDVGDVGNVGNVGNVRVCSVCVRAREKYIKKIKEDQLEQQQ